MPRPAPLVLTVAAALLIGGRASAQDVKWRHDYAAARREAADAGKPLLLDFGAEWCGPCKKLDATTFRDPNIVATLNESFVPVKLNGDKETKLVAAMGVDGFPTLIVAGPDGKVLARRSGYVTAAQLGELLARTPAAKPSGAKFDADRAIFRGVLARLESGR